MHTWSIHLICCILITLSKNCKYTGMDFKSTQNCPWFHHHLMFKYGSFDYEIETDSYKSGGKTLYNKQCFHSGKSCLFCCYVCYCYLLLMITKLVACFFFPPTASRLKTKSQSPETNLIFFDLGKCIVWKCSKWMSLIRVTAMPSKHSNTK